MLTAISRYGATRQFGLSLIEVLIALLVLSIGLVGLAALHLNSLSGTHSSYYRSLASSIALDLEERAWVALATTSADCPNVMNPNSPAFENFLDHWDAANANGFVGLPGLDVDVELLNGGGFPQWRLTVTWDEGRFDDVNDGREEFVYTIRVPCRETFTGEP